MGWVADESPIFGDYFKMANNPSVRGANLELYEADLGPLQSLHDRACELYQQIVGIMEVRDLAGLSDNDCGPGLARAVYGASHFDQEHAKY